MRACSQVPDSQKFQQDSKLAERADNLGSGDAKAALSDDELKQVSAAGTDYVPTVNVEIVLGRHDIAADQEKQIRINNLP